MMGTGAARFIRVLVGAPLAAVALGGLSASAAPTSAVARAYRLVVASDRDGGGLRAYSMRPDGSRLTPLLPHSKPADRIVLSRNGSTVAYVRPCSLSTSRANGTGLRPLRLPGCPDLAALSRDGRLLALDATAGKLWVTATDGRGLRQLASAAFFDDVDWSPDGKAVAFLGALTARDNRNALSSLVLQPLRGKRRVLAHGFLETVGWSPGGRWIAYINSSRRRRVEGLYVARTDGAKRRRVLPGSILTFAWSPDGTRLAVTSGVKDFTLVSTDGRVLRRLRLRGLSSIFLARLSWSPDGRYLAFSSEQNGLETVWMVGADGHGLRQLTRGGHSYVAGWTAAAPAQRAASPLLPSQWVIGATTVATRKPITALSADGPRTAFLTGSTTADCSHVVVWTPAERSAARLPTGRPKPCGGYGAGGTYDLGFAGSRAAWVEVVGCGNYCDVSLVSSSLARRSRHVVVFKPGAFLSPERPFSFHVRGHGNLLVYNGSAPDTLSRIGADGKPTVLRDDPSACCADSVSSGRIALRGARAVSVIDGTGRPVHVFAIPGDAARLDGERLVVARLGTLESYDVSSGAHVGSRALPAGYGLVDVHGGVAALRNGNAAIKLLRLADGRSFTLSPGKGPRFADLEGSGLYYSYGLASGEGRVVFLRRAAVERRLGS